MPISNPYSKVDDAIVLPFSYGDASPKPIAVVTGNILTVQLVISTPFNGIGATLQVGDREVSDRLMTVDQNSPVMVAEYESNPNYSYSTPTQILLSITSGEGCTQGNGYIVLEV